MPPLYEQISQLENRRNTKRIDKLFSVFNTKPRNQYQGDVSAHEALVGFGFIAGTPRQEFYGEWSLLVTDSSDYTVPDGWSVSQDGTNGTYTVTHNLGTTNYFVDISPIDINSGRAHGMTYNANDFVVYFEDAGSGNNTATAAKFRLTTL